MAMAASVRAGAPAAALVAAAVALLATRGLSPSAAVTFMLAAPILNPVVLASTLIAFRGRHPLAIAGARFAIGFIVAVVAGSMLGRRIAVDDGSGDACEHHAHRRRASAVVRAHDR
jgi:uncharacterized protein